MLYIRDTKFDAEMKLTREIIGKFMTDQFDVKIFELTVDEFGLF